MVRRDRVFPADVAVYAVVCWYACLCRVCRLVHSCCSSIGCSSFPLATSAILATLCVFMSWASYARGLTAMKQLLATQRRKKVNTWLVGSRSPKGLGTVCLMAANPSPSQPKWSCKQGATIPIPMPATATVLAAGWLILWKLRSSEAKQAGPSRACYGHETPSSLQAEKIQSDWSWLATWIRLERLRENRSSQESACSASIWEADHSGVGPSKGLRRGSGGGIGGASSPKGARRNMAPLGSLGSWTDVHITANLILIQVGQRHGVALVENLSQI